MTAMRPIAQAVPPNTWRVIGDRMRDDEAFIPINDFERSQQILAATAHRVGFTLLPRDHQPVPMGLAAGGLLDHRLAYAAAPHPQRMLPAMPTRSRPLRIGPTGGRAISSCWWRRLGGV